NYVYGEVVNLGNTEEGDGYLFIGRGLHQTTGRKNYQTFQNDYNKRFSKNIDIMSDPTKVGSDWDLITLSALIYFDKRGLQQVGNTANVRKVTKKINGGTIGLDGRYNYTNKALKVFGLSSIILTKDK